LKVSLSNFTRTVRTNKSQDANNGSTKNNATAFFIHRSSRAVRLMKLYRNFGFVATFIYNSKISGILQDLLLEREADSTNRSLHGETSSGLTETTMRRFSQNFICMVM